MLRIEGLSAGYGEAVVLQGISLALPEGDTLALLGRNGTGKTTLINTLAGATRQHAGTVSLGGVALHKLPPHERAAAGIGWVPQERNIFKSLTVHENLTAVARPGRKGSTARPWTPERVYEMFPRLAERRANLGTQLSGGEQQMLAVGRALASEPRLILIDELSLGLAPLIVKAIYDQLRVIVAQFGTSMLVVEQNARLALKYCDEAHVLERGRIVLAVGDHRVERRREDLRVLPRGDALGGGAEQPAQAPFDVVRGDDHEAPRRQVRDEVGGLLGEPREAVAEQHHGVGPVGGRLGTGMGVDLVLGPQLGRDLGLQLG